MRNAKREVNYSGDEQPARTACRERAAENRNNRCTRKSRNVDHKGVYRGGQGAERVHCKTAYRPKGNPSIRTGQGKRGKILVPKAALLRYFLGE